MRKVIDLAKESTDQILEELEMEKLRGHESYLRKYGAGHGPKTLLGGFWHAIEMGYRLSPDNAVEWAAISIATWQQRKQAPTNNYLDGLIIRFFEIFQHKCSDAGISIPKLEIHQILETKVVGKV